MPLNSEQQAVFDKIMDGQSVFLTGNAGTGKSYLLNHVITELRKQKRNFFVAAPTGIAAINVKGTTIHRLIGLSPRTNTLASPNRVARSKAIQLFNAKNNILIIDEISMCRVDIFEYLIRMIQTAEQKNNFKMQLILVGDFSQLSPFCGYNEKYLEKQLNERFGGLFAFLSPLWKGRNLETCCLHHIVRQHDEAFVNALNQIRLGKSEGVDFINAHANPFPIENTITLCGRKKTVDTKNRIALNKLDGKEFTFHSYSSPKFSKSAQPSVETLNLKIGARVMLTANGTAEQSDGNEESFFNGQMATVKSISYKYRGHNVTYDETGNSTNQIRREIKHQENGFNFIQKQLDKLTLNEAIQEEEKQQQAKQKYLFDFDAPAVTDEGDMTSDRYQVIITLENDDGHLFDISWHVWQEYSYKQSKKGVQKKSIGAYCQLPLVLAYAITIHKSQGQTFEQANFAPEVWADGQLYVALSRVKSVNRFYTEKPISKSLVKASPLVTKFYAEHHLFDVKETQSASSTKVLDRRPVLNFLLGLSDSQFQNASLAMRYIFDPDLKLDSDEELERFKELCKKARN